MLRVISAAGVPYFVVLFLVLDAVGFVEGRQLELDLPGVLLPDVHELRVVANDSIEHVLVLALLLAHYPLDVPKSAICYSFSSVCFSFSFRRKSCPWVS